MSRLDIDLTVREASEYVMLHEDCIETKGWGVRAAFTEMFNLRSQLTLW